MTLTRKVRREQHLVDVLADVDKACFLHLFLPCARRCHVFPMLLRCEMHVLNAFNQVNGFEVGAVVGIRVNVHGRHF
jgi:hypothetical protein